MKFVPAGPPRFDHQKRGLRWLIRKKGVAALLYDPGTGKTATALDYASILALKLHEARVLVICPVAALDTWVIQAGVYVHQDVNLWAEVLGGSIREKAAALAARGGAAGRATLQRAEKRRQQPRAAYVERSAVLTATRRDTGDIDPREGPEGLGEESPRLLLTVVNFESFSSRLGVRGRTSTMADLIVEGVKRYNPDLVIIDESHKIKSANSNMSRTLARLEPYIPRRVLLTGTVMPHGPMDVYGQWRFLDPYAFGVGGSKMTFGNFKSRFAVMGGYMGREVKAYKNLDEMQDIMAQRALVAQKRDVLDLPKTLESLVPYELDPAEQAAYNSMRKEMAVEFSEDEGVATAHGGLSKMMRLRQITSGHLPADDGTVRIVGDSKIRMIRSLVQDTLAGEDRIVIFCFFTHEINALVKTLTTPGTEVLRIAGNTPDAERRRLRERFGSDDPARLVLVAQVSTLSLSVNELVTACNAIFGSMSQRRDDWVQAHDRLDRIGQTRPVTFWYPQARGTVDEVIYRSHLDQTNLEDAMKQHILEAAEVLAA